MNVGHVSSELQDAIDIHFPSQQAQANFRSNGTTPMKTPLFSNTSALETTLPETYLRGIGVHKLYLYQAWTSLWSSYWNLSLLGGGPSPGSWPVAVRSYGHGPSVVRAGDVAAQPAALRGGTAPGPQMGGSLGRSVGRSVGRV